MNILDIFYNEIIKEAAKGKIEAYFYYNIIFSTRIVDKDVTVVEENELLVPKLIINDKERFDSLLIDYVETAKEFYKDNNFETNDEKNIIKSIIASLFSNATLEDFNNPCLFLKKRIDFFNNVKEENYELGYSNNLSATITMKIEKDYIYNETPYQFVLEAVDDNGDIYYFPHIKFGISDDTAYIYAIQNEKNLVNSKKISRALYKIGEGFDSKEDNYNKYEEGNLMDVTSSFLIALNILVAYLNKNNINKINIPSILIERWNAKERANQIKAYLNIIDSDTYESYSEKHISIQKNLTEKLIRTFLRLKEHHPNIEIESLPMEGDSMLRLNVHNLDECNNKLLNETKNLIISLNKEKLR